MMSTPTRSRRRRLLQAAGALALVPWLPTPLSAAVPELPAIPELTALLGTRSPGWGRLRMEMPVLADNGQAVPLRLILPGPFTAGRVIRTLHLFSERNPVPEMVVFEFPVAPDKFEIDTRVRLAGTQRVVAVAEMSDSSLEAAVAEVVVTLAACLDGS